MLNRHFEMQHLLLCFGLIPKKVLLLPCIFTTSQNKEKIKLASQINLVWWKMLTDADADRRFVWERVLLIGKPVIKIMLVCSRHFKQNDWMNVHSFKIPGHVNKVRWEREIVFKKIFSRTCEQSWLTIIVTVSALKLKTKLI